MGSIRSSFLHLLVSFDLNRWNHAITVALLLDHGSVVLHHNAVVDGMTDLLSFASGALMIHS